MSKKPIVTLSQDEEPTFAELNTTLTKTHSFMMSGLGFVVGVSAVLIVWEIKTPYHNPHGHWLTIALSVGAIIFTLVSMYRLTQKITRIFANDGHLIDHLFEVVSKAEEEAKNAKK